MERTDDTARDDAEPKDGGHDERTADEARLTADEVEFLLRDPAEQARKAERSALANRKRTERRHDDPAYAERLRAADRERQRRRRARSAIGQPEAPEAPAVPLPDLTTDEAAARLAEHLSATETPQAEQLRRRPGRIRDYAEGFTVYRALASDGARPTRGALAAMLRSRFGRSFTPSQIQKLRDHIEGFAAPGGPWHATGTHTRHMADTTRHAFPPKRG